MLLLLVRAQVGKVFPADGSEAPWVLPGKACETALSVLRYGLAAGPPLWQPPAGMDATPFPIL